MNEYGVLLKKESDGGLPEGKPEKAAFTIS